MCPSTAYRGTQTAEIKKSGIIAADVPFNYLQGHSNGTKEETSHIATKKTGQLLKPSSRPINHQHINLYP